MHRSSSSSNARGLISDAFFVNMSQATMASSSLVKAKAASASASASASDYDLPEYVDSITGTTKKQIAYHHHNSNGEKAIHLIPVVLTLCALTLWLFSRPAGKV